MRSSVTIGAAALVAVLASSAMSHANPPPMTRDQIIQRGRMATNPTGGGHYSYWWGHGRWRTDGKYQGSCSGSCPSCTHYGSYGADCSGFVAKTWQVPSA